MIYTNILIVEDEQIVAKNIEKRLTAAGYKVVASVSTGEEAIEKVKNLSPDVILMDIKLKGKMDGIEAADFIRKDYQLPIIFLTSYTDEETFQRAKITEPFGYLIKPFEIKELNRAVEIAIYKNKIYKELLDTKQRFQIAFEAGKTAIWELMIEKDEFILDPSVSKLFGYTQEDLKGSAEERMKYVYEEDREQLSKIMQECLEGKLKSFETEHRIYRKDGSVGWILLRGAPILSENNKPTRLVGSATDITERKNYEEALKKSEEKFRSIFESSGIGMAILGPAGQFIKVNEAFCEMIGYTEKEIVETNFRDISHPGDLEKSVELTKNLLKSETLESSFIEKRYLHKNGEVIWTLTTVSLIRDFEGKPLYFIAQVQNITKRKKYEEQLLKYADELKTLNAAKDKFFSIISHDLRSPFNSLLGVTEFITQSYDEMSPAEIKESISNIYRSSQKVYNLILNLLEWSRLQSGRFEVDKLEINLNKLIDEIINLYQQNAKTKEINLSSIFTEEIIVYADRYMIETVFRNLISNALKFTSRGGIVTVSVIKKGNSAEVTVADNGIGISEENQKKLFRIDEQYKSNGTAEEKGTGLGLILCREFVEKNSGTIILESKESKGTKLIITIPTANPKSN